MNPKARSAVSVFVATVVAQLDVFRSRVHTAREKAQAEIGGRYQINIDEVEEAFAAVAEAACEIGVVDAAEMDGVAEPAEPPAGEPVEPPAGEPVEPPAGEPVEPPADDPTEDLTR